MRKNTLGDFIRAEDEAFELVYSLNKELRELHNNPDATNVDVKKKETEIRHACMDRDFATADLRKHLVKMMQDDTGHRVAHAEKLLQFGVIKTAEEYFKIIADK